MAFVENFELSELLENQKRDFRVKFGRDPKPEDPFFVTEDDGESIRPGDKQVITAMSDAGVHAEFIYVFHKTGIYRRWDEGDNLTPKRLRAWDQALSDYLDAMEASRLM
jgi:hypothetical protein